MAGIPPSLHTLLGDDLEGLEDAELDKLIGLPEGQHLEFKRDQYGREDPQKAELRRDAVQFANSGGGIVFVGVEEDNGVASRLAPFKADSKRSEVCQWIEQVLSTGISPSLTFATKEIRMDGGSVVAISVPSSSLQPHCVASPTDALEYPIRVGTTRRCLSETEVSTRYRARFEASADRDRQIQSLMDEARNLATGDVETDYTNVWVVLASVPDIGGFVEMSSEIVRETEHWLQESVLRWPGYTPSDYRLAARYRSLVLRDRDRDQAPDLFRGQLNLDGSSVLTFSTRMKHVEKGQGFLRWNETFSGRAAAAATSILITDLLGLVNAAVSHTERCASQGGLTLAAQVIAPIEHISHLALIEPDPPGPPNQLRGTDTITNPSAPVSRTFALTEIASSRSQQRRAGALLARDLLSNFGLTELREFDAAGNLVDEEFHQDVRPMLSAWKDPPTG